MLPTSFAFIADKHRVLGKVVVTRYAPGLSIDHGFWVRRRSHDKPLRAILPGGVSVPMSFVESVDLDCVSMNRSFIDEESPPSTAEILQDLKACGIKWPQFSCSEN